MTKEEIFTIWSPETSLWSRWTKPVLFAHLNWPVTQNTPDEPADVHWCPPADETVLILDLPGAEGALAALQLAGKGYQPVPLYNAVPLPSGHSSVDPATGRPVAAIDVMPILHALVKGAEQLRSIKIPSDAPPAFLLDANRLGNRRMEPDEFDNRSVCFTTDFPSANFLWAHGLRHVLLVQRNRSEPQTDLSHTLRRWQDAGLTLRRVRLDALNEPEHFEIPRLSWYRAMFQRALAAFGLYRAPGGGFGAWVPDSSSGG